MKLVVMGHRLEIRTQNCYSLKIPDNQFLIKKSQSLALTLA
jgi:hypothetical protein